MWFFLARRLSFRCHSVALTVRHILILEWRLGTTSRLVRHVNKHNLYHPSPAYRFCRFLQFSPVSPYFARCCCCYCCCFLAFFRWAKPSAGQGWSARRAQLALHPRFALSSARLKNTKKKSLFQRLQSWTELNGRVNSQFSSLGVEKRICRTDEAKSTRS